VAACQRILQPRDELIVRSGMCYVLTHVFDTQLDEILKPEDTDIPDMACEQPTERNWTQKKNM
jgi:hypothetical protein